MYPQPSMDSPRMAGRLEGWKFEGEGGKVIREYSVPMAERLEEEGGKVIREYNVPPAIHGQSEHG